MNPLAGSLLFLLPALVGGLTIHGLWPDRRPAALLLKASLGIGLGLGISSILAFVSLLIAPGQRTVLPASLVLVIVLLALILRREGVIGWPRPSTSALSGVQWGLMGLGLLAAVFSVLTFANLSGAWPQGAFDSWAIWNRAARFIFRDPGNWQATFSPRLFWLTHADYPLLVPLNVAWGWDEVGYEANQIPGMQSFLFLAGTLVMLFSALCLFRSVGQGSLAAVVLAGIPNLYLTGHGQTADVPLGFFILATCALICAGLTLQHDPLFGIGGFMAGLAAWTKNEGLLFVLVSLCALLITAGRQAPAAIRWYFAGLIVPVTVVLYFKFALAPPGDLFNQPAAVMLQKAVDPTRVWLILRALADQIISFGGAPVGIFVPLVVYMLIGGGAHPAASGARTTALILLFQLIGYCGIYLLTPQDLQRHLFTSLGRLVMQLTPAIIFLIFMITVPPEQIFARDEARARLDVARGRTQLMERDP